LSGRDLAAVKEKWTISKVAGLETVDIVSRLRKLGIDAERATFVPLTRDHTSAWRVGDTWVAGVDRQLRTHEEHFVFLAACELWKRHCPERPSEEMVDDWVTEGYGYAETGEDAKAVDVWLRVWEHLRPRLRPHMTTFDAVDPMFRISQFFLNWIQDFETALEDAARKDREYAETGIRILREVLERFTNEEENTILNFRCDLARFLFLAGRMEEGEATLQAAIHGYPHRAHGYVTLSDELSAVGNPRQDISRAIALLEQALAYPVVDAADWDIEVRLDDLRARKASRPVGGDCSQ
jgi:hypothetical protein